MLQEPSYSARASNYNPVGRNPQLMDIKVEDENQGGVNSAKNTLPVQMNETIVSE
jgi:hypothetical protein